MRAFQQGSLDGMCGVYALINAVNLVTPRPEEDFELMMKACVHAIHEQTATPYFFVQGIGMHEMIQLFRMVVRPNFPIVYKRPFARNAGVSLNQYWKTCRAFLEEEHRAILLALATQEEQHWTVVSAMADKHLRLLDSGEWNAIKRASITTKAGKTRKPVRIFPAQSFFLQRKA